MKPDAKAAEALSRAEKFLARKNYPEALKAFEAALAPAAPEVRARIAEEIGVCRREMNNDRVAILIGRAERRAGKDDIEALRCLDGARTLLAEIQGAAGLEAGKKIEELRRRCLDSRKLQQAQDLEAAGEFGKAAELYGEIAAGSNDERTLIRRAVCLTRAGKPSEALACLERLPGPRHAQPSCDAAHLYSYGFALASAGRYFECLRAWDMIECRDDSFAAQRSAVFSAFARGLLGRLRESADPREEEVRYLSTLARERPNLTELAQACRRACVERLWSAERFESARELLLWPSAALPEGRPPSPALLLPLAQILYRLAETSGKYLDEFVSVWLAAVHHPAAQAAFSTCAADAVRAKLIAMAESLLSERAQTGDASAKRAWALWIMEKPLVAELHALAGREAQAQGLVCPPRHAERAGLCEPILHLIAQRRSFFRDEEHYLRTGACYSGGLRGLFHLENGELDEAQATLPVAQSPSSRCLAYARQRVDFALALEALEKGSARPERFLKRCANLFALSPAYEKALIDGALEAHDSGKLDRYEKALMLVHAKRPGPGINKALSLLHSRLGVRLFNEGAIDPETLELYFERSLDLDPENELARSNLSGAQADRELERLHDAITLGKNNAAARIAAQSRHAEVKDFFFEFMGQCLREAGDDVPGEGRLLVLLELKKMCSAVDASHPILDQIEASLAPVAHP